MKVIGVFSVKGGVGKTFVTCGLAKAFNALGFKVGIGDCDFTAPNIPLALGVVGKPTRGKGDVIIPVDWNGIKVLSWAMIWPEDSPVLIDDVQIDEEDLNLAISMLAKGEVDKAIKYLKILRDTPPGALLHMKLFLDSDSVDWGDPDYLFLDTAPSSSGVVREVASSNMWGGIIVTIPSKLSIADVRRTIGLFRKKRVPILGLVCNMSGRELFDVADSEVEAFAASAGVPFLGRIPHSKNPDAHFTAMARIITSSTPLRLPENVPVIDEGALRRFTKLADLLEVFKSAR